MGFKLARNLPSSDNSPSEFKQGRHLGKVAFIVIGMILTAVLGLIGICAFGIHRANYAELTAGLPEWSLDGKGERVLIFAPHCDDETLACGGLISRLRSRGVPVKVVFATNGDAFRISCVKEFHQINVGPSHFVRFGYVREKEVLKALGKLGVSPKDVIFLGYPDRGLSKMWLEDWDRSHLLRSAYTDDDHSPYRTSYHKRAPYCGESLLNDIESILRAYRPTSVYYPHTYEQHPDHWAASCFMTEALYDTGMLGKIRTGLYLVHRGDWPVPQGVHLERSMPPPASLKDLGTKWYEFDLGGEGIEKRKLGAIKTYKTQTDIMGRFLTSFARTNELFGVYPPETLTRVKGIGGASDVMWSTIQPSILDPVGDNIDVDVDRSGDLKEIRCCYNNKFLYVRIGLAHQVSSSTSYILHLHVLPNPDTEPINLQTLGNKCSDPAVRVSSGRNAVELAVPISKLCNWNAVMLSADSKYRRITLDQTAWRVLRRESPPSQAAKKP